MELAQDLKAIHGLDAKLNWQTSYLLKCEINREVVRTIYINSEKGVKQTQLLLVSLI